MAIPVVDPLPIAPSDERRSTFDAEMFAFLQAMEALPGQINALVPFLAAAAGRSAISAVYTFSTATSGDPTAGKFRLNNATQGSSTGAGLDLLDANGVDVSGVLARMGAGTSAIKGDLLVTLVGDPTVYLFGEVTAGTSPSGYRSLTLQNVTVSSPNPFTAGDQILVIYVRNGDKGDTGATGDVGPHAIYEEQRASGTGSSTPHVGGAQNTVALNTEVKDSLGIFSLSGSDVVIGAAGTYLLEGEAVAFGVDAFQINLFNVTDTTVIQPGLSAVASKFSVSLFAGAVSTVSAEITIAGPKTIRMRAFIQNDPGSLAMGYPSSSGLGEVFARLKITKKA